MTYFSSSEEWQRQSSLLIQAHPETTRITTKYNIPNLDSERYARKRKRSEQQSATKSRSQSQVHPERDETSPAAAVAAAQIAQSTDTKPIVPKAIFELKTYDPVSGVVIKYKTDKAAEVSRLIAASGRLARDMAGLPALTTLESKTETETEMATQAGTDAGRSVDHGAGTKESVPAPAPAPGSATAKHVAGPTGTKGGDTIKKKKKGKK